MRRLKCCLTVAMVAGGAFWGANVLAQGASPGAGAGATASQGDSQQQQPGPGQSRRGQFAGMSRMAGEVTGVSGATITIKTEDNGTAQVFTTENTRLIKDRQPVKVSDLRAGDGLMAFGNLDTGTKTLHAAMVVAEDAATVKAMRENLGKTYITGRVTAIDLDNARMTVERPDHVAQTIGFDETTSFKRLVRSGGNGGANGGGARGEGGGMAGGQGIDRAFANGESITLADIKVGDGIAGNGSVKGGVFVPTHLLDTPRRQRENAAPGGASPAGPAAGPAPGPNPGQR